ncbi:MAG: hypothetical protein Tsb0032_01070 [Kiloniellaceae bacterium]
MLQEKSPELAFARLRNELAGENRQAFPGETTYFLSHERRYLSELKLIAGLCTRGRILEIGGYPFFFTCVLQRLGFPVTSVDLQPFRLTRFLKRYRLNVVACNVERQRLPFADGTFAHVIFNEVLEHLRVDPLLALSEANRVLAPGGSLLLTTPNLYFVKTVIKFLLGRGFNDPLQEFGKLRGVGHMGHIREYSRGEVRRLVEASGFTIQSHRLTQHNYPRNLFGAVSYPLLSLLPFLQGTQIVIATKTAEGPKLSPLTRG